MISKMMDGGAFGSFRSTVKFNFKMVLPEGSMMHPQDVVFLRRPAPEVAVPRGTTKACMSIIDIICSPESNTGTADKLAALLLKFREHFWENSHKTVTEAEATPQRLWPGHGG